MIVDACIWVSLLNNNDIHHDKVMSWFKTAHCSFNIPVICIAEVAGALSRRANKELAQEAVDFLLSKLIIKHAIDEKLAVRAASVATKYGLRGYDSVYVALAAQTKLALLTLDNELIKKKISVEIILP